MLYSLNASLRRAAPGARLKAEPVLVVTFALIAALLGGALIAVLPWWFVLAFLILPLLTVAGVAFPEIAIAGAWILLSGLVPEQLTPRLPLGPGVVKAHELALVLLAALAFFRALQTPALGRYRAWLWPVAPFILLTLSAVAVGLVVSKSPVKDVLQDARNLLGWLMVFIVVYLVRTERQIYRLVWGLVICGALVALAVVLQFATGRHLLQDAPVQQLVTLSQGVSDVIRSSAGGGTHIMVFSMLVLLGWLITRATPFVVAAPLLILVSAGLVATFGRGIWIATLLACLMLAYFLQRWKGVAVVVIVVVVSIATGLAALSVFKPRAVEAAFDRALSTTRESLDPDTTLGWRAEETKYALKSIGQSPLWGIGFGTAYKPVIRLNGLTTTEQDEFLSRYNHNAYLSLWLKFGVLGLVAALWLSWSTIRRGFSTLRAVGEPRAKALTAALICSFLVVFVVSVTQPEWVSQAGIAFYGLMVGCLVCIHRITESKAGAGAKVTGSRRSLRF